ncbi:MAG: nucleotidyltransferase family protein [Bacilli bacterium]|nr:nucleotidyltransferase family protein [Bacilli bacterium]
MRKGCSDGWINQRLKAIDARKEFTDELKHKGIEKSNDFAALTNLLTKVWSGFSVKEYKEYKGLTKENNEIKIYAPYGLSDIFSKTIRPIKHKYNTKEIYDKKVMSWNERFDNLNIIGW